MALVVLLIQILLLWPTPATSSNISVAKPGCQEKCGNITVPNPFGFGDASCYRPGYDVKCNHSFVPPKLFLGNDSDRPRGTEQLEVLEISLLQGQLRINSFVAYDCYNDSYVKTNSSAMWINLNDCPYRTILATGCSTICLYDGENFMKNGTCSGVGCCQTTSMLGLKQFVVEVDSTFNHSDITRYSPCSFAFMVDNEWYSFSTIDLLGRNFYSRTGGKVPLVLDWAIEKYLCENASTNDPFYACGKNSECYNSPNGLGYLCNCSRGYQGNPYLPDGCQGNIWYIFYEFLYPKLNFVHYTGVGVGVFSMVFSVYWLYQVFKKKQINKRKKRFFKRNGGLLLQQQIPEEGNIEKIKVFEAEELESATDHYNVERILGQGGQGTVYKGMLSNGRTVAIKKSKIVDESQLTQFINEVVLLSQINHRNIVKLLGCCLETEIPLLVYEFISGGTLHDLLHNYNEDFPFLWDDRLRIAMEKNLVEILDPRILKEGKGNEIEVVANLAMRCLNWNGKERPTMKEVVVELEGLRMPERNSLIQKNNQEGECYISETSSLWDTGSTSVGFKSSESSFTSLLDEQPLLHKTSSK
uniref:Protein kinase domain-containing protein n=1 Tax=Nelumbo nucifera TaxID=4432 RepID=A0A822Z8F1_NELNU|nr:TPA_asm: hypothetical protein HUJ06_000874 [Nelumbo nucifera]